MKAKRCLHELIGEPSQNKGRFGEEAYDMREMAEVYWNQERATFGKGRWLITSRWEDNVLSGSPVDIDSLMHDKSRISNADIYKVANESN